MAGNRQGGRLNYLYYTDNTGVAYVMPRDTDLVFAGLGEGAASPELYDPENPPAGVIVTPIPQRFTPRVVHIQSNVDGARKALTCFHPESEVYLRNFRQAIAEIDDDSSFFSTGRRGEQISF